MLEGRQGLSNKPEMKFDISHMETKILLSLFHTANNGNDSLLLYATITQSSQETDVPLPNLLCRSPCACHTPLVPVEPKTGHKYTVCQLHVLGRHS